MLQIASCIPPRVFHPPFPLLPRLRLLHLPPAVPTGRRVCVQAGGRAGGGGYGLWLFVVSNLAAVVSLRSRFWPRALLSFRVTGLIHSRLCTQRASGLWSLAEHVCRSLRAAMSVSVLLGRPPARRELAGALCHGQVTHAAARWLVRAGADSPSGNETHLNSLL